VGIERDLARIGRRLVLYFEVRATQGRCLSEQASRDPLLVRHLALVDSLVRLWEARRCAEGNRGS
jgi:hypothetical protein